MSVIAYLRSRFGLHHAHLTCGSDSEAADKLAKTVQKIGAVGYGSHMAPDGSLSVYYFRVGREGFRVCMSQYVGIEGIDVRGSRWVVDEFSKIWQEIG